MHFFSVAAVADELKRGPIGSLATFRYFSAWLTLNTVLGYYDVQLMAPASKFLLVQALAIIVVTVTGLYWCYLKNGGISGTDLTGRFVALALPLTVQLTVAYEVFYWGAFWIYPHAAESLADHVYESIWLSLNVAGAIVMWVVWYWRMAMLLSSVNGAGSVVRESNSGDE